MARSKETPVPLPGQKGRSSAKPQLSQDYVSLSSSSEHGSEDSESHSNSEDSDSSDGESSDGTDSGSSSDPEDGRRDTTAPALQSRRAYAPPRGLRSLTTNPSSSRASKLFDPTNLAGKQIWHIIAPASVPVSNLKEVSTQKVTNGEAVLSYNGSDYGFVTLDKVSADTKQTKLLVPSKRGYQLGL